MLTKVNVRCVSCGELAPWQPPCAEYPDGAYLWHQPCPKCGENNWGAFDLTRDWRTGKLLVEDKD